MNEYFSCQIVKYLFMWHKQRMIERYLREMIETLLFHPHTPFWVLSWKLKVRRNSSVLYIVALLLWVCIGRYPLAPHSVLRAIASNDFIVNPELALWGSHGPLFPVGPQWVPLGSYCPHERNFFHIHSQMYKWLKREKYLGYKYLRILWIQ